MTQKLATLKAGTRPLDWGLNIVFTAEGMRAEGRPDSAGYRGPWYGGLAANDVNVTDVADDYAIVAPAPAAPTAGRDLLESEFFRLGLAINPTGVNEVLANLPALGILTRRYANEAGLAYADATTAGHALHDQLAAVVGLGFITAGDLVAFLAAWRSSYPAGS